MSIMHSRTGRLSVSAVLVLSALVCSCGIFPKINQDPDSRKTEASSVVVTVPGGTEIPSEQTGEEEILDMFARAKKNRREAREFLYHFFDIAYDQYLSNEIDLSAVLDLSDEECLKLENDLRKAAGEYSKSLINGTAAPEKLPYEIVSLGASESGSEEDGNLSFSFVFLLKPLSSENSLSEEDYLQYYPPFLHFGANVFTVVKHQAVGVSDGWKIESIYSRGMDVHIRQLFEDMVVRKYYDAIWKQYVSLKYTGLQGIIDENSEDYRKQEEVITECIENWETHLEAGKPKELDYRIRIVKASINPPGGDWNELGTIRFILEPELAEDIPIEEQLSRYPAFMEFGEHCWSINAIPGTGELLTPDGEAFPQLLIRNMKASEVEGAIVDSAVKEEMQETLNAFFRRVRDDYVRMQDVDLSDILDMSSEECAKISEELKEAIEERRAEDGANSQQQMVPWKVEVLDCNFESIGTLGSLTDPMREAGRLQFRLKIFRDEESWNMQENVSHYTKEEFGRLLSLPEFMEEMEGVNAFSFNWNDGTCKIDGFDASKKFEEQR